MDRLKDRIEIDIIDRDVNTKESWRKKAVISAEWNYTFTALNLMDLYLYILLFNH